MADMSRQKALANRLLMKVANPGTITLKSDILGVADQTTNVRVKIIDRESKPEAPVQFNAVISATPFPIRGGILTTNGVSYDIVAVVQSGVGTEHIVQKAVLHER